MAPPYKRGTTITRLRGKKVSDGYGGERTDWTNPTKLVVPGCAMAPRVEDELTEKGRQGVIIGWTLYGPWADIVVHDRVETPYGTFEVDGDPGLWESPTTGRQPGMTVRLMKVRG